MMDKIKVADNIEIEEHLACSPFSDPGVVKV